MCMIFPAIIVELVQTYQNTASCQSIFLSRIPDLSKENFLIIYTLYQNRNCQHPSFPSEKKQNQVISKYRKIYECAPSIKNPFAPAKSV